MNRIEQSVFLSYRRTSVGWALAIWKSLKEHGYDVFIDYHGLASGHFKRALVEHIKARAHFLVLLTPSALERCKEPDDWLLLEVQTALESRRNIVPLTLDGFDFTESAVAKDLVGPLKSLAEYNPLRLHAEYFDAGMERLRSRYLNIPLETVLHPLTAAATEATTDQRSAANAALAVQQRDLSAEQWFEQGLTVADVDEQLRCFTEAIRLKPERPATYLARGAVRARNCDRTGASDDFATAIRLEPLNADAFIIRGETRRELGDRDGALADLTEAVRLQPDRVLTYCNRSLLQAAAVPSLVHSNDTRISVEPARLVFGAITRGVVNTLPIKLRSVGTGDVVVKGIVIDTDWIAVRTPDAVSDDVCLIVEVDTRSLKPGRHSGLIEITSNDIVRPSILVSVLVTVIPDV